MKADAGPDPFVVQEETLKEAHKLLAAALYVYKCDVANYGVTSQLFLIVAKTCAKHCAGPKPYLFSTSIMIICMHMPAYVQIIDVTVLGLCSHCQ